MPACCARWPMPASASISSRAAAWARSAPSSPPSMRRTRLWEPSGIWTGPSRPRPLSVAVALARCPRWCVAATLLALAAPLAVLALLAVAWLPAFVLELVAPRARRARSPRNWPIWALWVTRGETATATVSRACAVAVLALGVTLVAACVRERQRPGRRAHGAPWWLALGAPLDAQPVVRWAARRLLELHPRRDAARRVPTLVDLARRYTELLARQPDAAGLSRAHHRGPRSRDAARPGVRAAPRGRAAALLRHRARAIRAAPRSSTSPAPGTAHVMDAVAAALAVPLPDRAAPAPLRHDRLLARRGAPRLRSARRRSCGCSRRCRRPAPSRSSS